jgi:tRNA pseudouridine55 synthase
MAGFSTTLPVDGVLLLDKPRGLSSNAALQRVKRAMGARKAGHVGTLDPMASGLLPVCLGEATKFSGYMLAADKGYAADVLLGVTSTTGDAEGEMTAGGTVAVKRDELEAVLGRFCGDIMQVPPMFSALKRDGKPLYAYARAGQTLEIAPRPVTIRAIRLTDFRPPEFSIEVRCSKGTYIRVLAEDIGRALGCGGLLNGLRRTGVGAFDISAAVSLEDLEALPADARLQHLLPEDTLVSELPEIVLDAAGERLISTGRRVPTAQNAGLYRLYGAKGRFAGLGEVAGGELAAKRLMTPVSAPK